MEDWKIENKEVTNASDAVLGKGSFGKVYLKEWRRTHVAVKIIETNNTIVNELFVREFDIMTKMHHPNIVQLLGFIEKPFAIVMEYLSGGCLVDKMPITSLAKKKQVVLDVLRGLAYMHNRKPYKCIHRDIKPRNILFTRSGMAKIADLGLSKLIKTSSHNESNEIYEMSDNVGTERYQAPEARGTEYDTPVDIYSSGIVFFELFENQKFTKDFYWSNTPKEIRELINSMINKNSLERPNACECYDHVDTRLSTKIWSRICC